MLIVEPIGGLANRMRVINAAVSLCADLSRPLRLLWNRDADLNCRFTELFEVPEEVTQLVDRLRPKAVRKAVHSPLARLRHFGGLKRDVFLDQKHLMQLIESDSVAAFVNGHSAIHIQTYTRFYRGKTIGWFERIALAETMQPLVSTCSSQIRNAVGVHVRRGDNQKSRQMSPLSLFVDAMGREIEKDPLTKFFLATDDPSVEEVLVHTFRDRVMVHAKSSLSRGRPEGIKDALVDLWCLSMCRKIYGSYWSSFSDVASELNGVPKETLSVVEL